jgi:hypothetical protein
MSVTAKAQYEGSEAIKQMAVSVDDITKSFITSTPMAVV